MGREGKEGMEDRVREDKREAVFLEGRFVHK